MTQEIIKVAEDFREINKQIKDLQAKEKPLKAELLKYAEEHREDFNSSFKLPFPNGTYVSLRVADVLEGDKDAKAKLLEETADEYVKTDLDEKAVIASAPKNGRLRKLLTKLGLKIAQKETLAVYA